MRVLLVNKFHYRKGGSETYYFAVADALKELGPDYDETEVRLVRIKVLCEVAN